MLSVRTCDSVTFVRILSIGSRFRGKSLPHKGNDGLDDVGNKRLNLAALGSDPGFEGANSTGVSPPP